MLECCGYGNRHALIRVSVFSIKVTSLYYAMVNFDGRLLFFGQLFHLGTNDYGNKEGITNWVNQTLKGERLVSE